MSSYRLLLVAIVIFVTGFARHAAAKDDKPFFTPPPLASFAGSAWGSLQIGTSTARSVKDGYRVEKHGNTVPWSIMVASPQEADCQINANFAGKDDKTAPLESVLVRYPHGRFLPDIVEELGGKAGTIYYQPGRTSNWSLCVWEDRGIVCFLDGDHGTDLVKVILLGSPAATSHGIAGMTAQEQPVVIPVDPHAGESKVMEFGTAEVYSSLDGMSLASGEKEDLERGLIDATAQGTMRYSAHAPGSYTAAITGNYDRAKGTGAVTVTCSIGGNSPYGPIAASAEETELIYQTTGPSFAYTYALQLARSRAEASFAQQMSAAGPPDPDTVRKEAWDDLFNRLRAAYGRVVMASGGQLPAGSLTR